jgi:imidazole glycerol phosphate synthase glutamine amidotransferase subunit
MITIFDYGAGNLQSVKNTLGAIGAPYELVRDSDGLRRATKIILPGVGHFGQTMRAIDELGVREAFVERIHAGVPFLGICLGLQALFASSEEAPEVHGLGVYEGQVKRFQVGTEQTALRIPHMGWNQVTSCRPTRLLKGLGTAPYMYFAHSYYCPVVPATAATCVQFHPEKSGDVGLAIVRNFVED